jgi:hypothetical protein
MADSLVRSAGRTGETALTAETSSDSQRGRRSSRRGYSDGRNRFSSCRGSRAECACSPSAMRPADWQRLSVRRWSTGIKVGCPSRFHGRGSLPHLHGSFPFRTATRLEPVKGSVVLSGNDQHRKRSRRDGLAPRPCADGSGRTALTSTGEMRFNQRLLMAVRKD